MSFLQNILKPFIEFEEGKPKPSKQLEPEADEGKKEDDFKKPAAETSQIPDRANGYTSGSTNSSLGQYKQYFENLIEEANNKNPIFQGTDFKEFIDSKADVEAITDEATKYKTAFNVLKRTGLTKEKLVTTGQEYVRIVDTDMKGFEEAFRQQYKTDVEQKEQLLQKKAEELQMLNDKIAAINADIKKMSQEIIQTKERLSSNRSLFIHAGEDKKEEILAELEKIQQYF